MPLAYRLASDRKAISRAGHRDGWRYPYEAVVQDVLMMTDDIAGTQAAYRGFDMMGLWMGRTRLRAMFRL